MAIAPKSHLRKVFPSPSSSGVTKWTAEETPVKWSGEKMNHPPNLLRAKEALRAEHTHARAHAKLPQTQFMSP